jgi:hypothetical protein
VYGEDNDLGRFEGEWVQDKTSGNGTLLWKNGASYVGHFLDGVRQGTGIQTFPADDPRLAYDGEWEDDVPSGHGTMTLKSGEKFEGEWENGVNL